MLGRRVLGLPVGGAGRARDRRTVRSEQPIRWAMSTMCAPCTRSCFIMRKSSRLCMSFFPSGFVTFKKRTCGVGRTIYPDNLRTFSTVADRPEYISGKLSAWAERREIKLAFIQSGKPQQNAYIERYNRTVRYDWLAQYLFDSTEEVQDYATRWLWFKAVCRSPVAVPTTKNCQKRPFITYRPPGDY